MLNAAYLRHFFNLRHQGISRPSIIVVSAILFVVIAVASDRLASGPLQTERDLSMDLLADQEMLTLVDQHCGNCHAKEPSFPGYTSPPGGIVLDSLGALEVYRTSSLNSLKSGYMPLGNMQGLTEEKRAEMVRYLQQ